MKIKSNKTKFKSLVLKYYEEAKNTLLDLLKINSIYDGTSINESTPFGKGVDSALSYLAKFGQEKGFSVDRCDNYVTELSIGEGNKVFDIYCHLDVVPVKESGWSHDPFDPIIKDNVIYARGASDDKGPLVSCLYGLIALKDNNLLNHNVKVRFIAGGDEERGSRCLDHYFNKLKKGYPNFGISPDADYPLIYGEKSIYNIDLNYDIEIPNVEDFSLGTALNIVIDEAKIKVANVDCLLPKFNEYLSSHKEIKGSVLGNEFTIIGKPAHGSLPFNGINAGLYMLDFLGQAMDIPSLITIFEGFNNSKGEKFNGNFMDKDFDCSTYNVGKIKYKDKKLTLFINYRFPPKVDNSAVILAMSNVYPCTILNSSGSKGFVSNLKNPFIKQLLKAYQKETGDKKSKPIAIGGGTYARESQNSVAFGAQFQNRDYLMHGNDEFMPLDDFYLDLQIYCDAIFNIVKLLGK